MLFFVLDEPAPSTLLEVALAHGTQAEKPQTELSHAITRSRLS